MKKLIAVIAVLSLSVSFTYAQYISLGPIAGFGHSGMFRVSGDKENGYSSKFHPSFSAGLSMIYAKHAHWGFGVDLLYSYEGAKRNIFRSNVLRTWDIDVSNNVSYIRMPIKAIYFFGRYRNKVRPKIHLGPVVGLNLSDNEKLEGKNSSSQFIIENNDLQYNRHRTFDVGLQAGVGLNITLAKKAWLNLDLSYYQGFLDATKTQPAFNQDVTHWNNNARVNIGVLFGL